MDTNVVTFITPDGTRELPLMSKADVADAILDEISPDSPYAILHASSMNVATVWLYPFSVFFLLVCLKK